MTRLVDEHLAAARHDEHRRQAEPVVAHGLGELDPLRRQLGDRRFDVVAHQRDLVVLVTGVLGRVDAELARARAEDQPAAVGIDVRPLQHVAEEGPGSIGVVGVDERVHSRDHPAQNTTDGWGQRLVPAPGGNEADVIVRRDRPGGDVEITFRLPLDHPAAPVGVGGEFNDWDWAMTPFVEHGEHLLATAVVEPGRRYQFRYRTTDERWFNDEDADDYVANEFGGVNCVIDLA